MESATYVESAFSTVAKIISGYASRVPEGSPAWDEFWRMAENLVRAAESKIIMEG